MGGGGVRWICQSTHLHLWSDLESLDALRDPVALCAALGTAKNKTCDEPGHHARLSGRACGWQSPPRSAGLGCALLAQRKLSRRAGGCEADSRGRALRFQLALRHRDRLFLRCDRLRIVARSEPFAIDESLLENSGANASGDGCDLIHAGAGLPDALLGTGRGVGPGLYAHGMAVSVFRHVPGVAGSA